MKLTRTELRDDIAAMERRITSGPGVVSPERRAAAAAGKADEGPLGSYLEKVRRHAYKVTDEEVAALRAAGASDDELFELTVAAAVGAGRERLNAGLAAISAFYDGGGD